METTAASWQGAVQVRLNANPADGTDWADIRLVPWHGQGTHRTLYVGPVGEYMNTINPDASHPHVSDASQLRQEAIQVIEAMMEEDEDNGAARDRAAMFVDRMRAAERTEGDRVAQRAR